MDSTTWLTRWERIRQGTLATFDLFLEGDLGFAPVAGGYTVREIALPIAHEEAIEILHGLARVIADLLEPYPVESFSSKRSIVDQLTGVHAQSTAYLQRLDPVSMGQEIELAREERLRPIDVVLHVIEHETHHRGELSLTLGLLGRRGFDA